MKTNVYNILWADDDVDALIDRYEERFNDNDIAIVKWAHDGKELEEMLSTSIHEIDAVIVDANFNYAKIVPGNKLNERNISGLEYAHSLYVHKFNRSIPFFLFTQRTDEMLHNKLDERPEFNDDFKRHETWFRKNDDDELFEMFECIKDVVDHRNTNSFRIRNKYKEEFKAAKLIPNAEELLFKGLITEFSDYTSNEAIIECFTPVRMLFEKIIDNCQSKNYIPYLSSLNSVCDFLDQKEVDGFKLTKSIMHKTLVHSLDFFLSITQDGSHDKTSLPLEVVDYVRNKKNNNLYRSILYIAMDLLLWYKDLLDQIPEPYDLWTGTYEATGRVCAKMNGKHCAYVVNGEYQIENNGDLQDGDEVYIIKSTPSRFPFEKVTKYVFKDKYKIKK